MTQLTIDKSNLSLESKTSIGYIADNVKLSNDIYQMTIENPALPERAEPGQFVSIYCDSMILRRPFSISNTDKRTFQIIYKVIGNGTQYLSGLESGDSIDFIGPLGNGFNVTPNRSLLIGAGVGIAPVGFLAKKLTQKQIEYKTLFGLKTLINIENSNLTSDLIVTEDNSSVHQGLVTHYIENEIKAFNPEKIYACGPKIVLQKASEIAQKYNIEIEVALEEKFACGVGVCMGCVIEVYENNEIVNKRICKDGPVFKGEDIVW